MKVLNTMISYCEYGLVRIKRPKNSHPKKRKKSEECLLVLFAWCSLTGVSAGVDIILEENYFCFNPSYIFNPSYVLIYFVKLFLTHII